MKQWDEYLRPDGWGDHRYGPDKMQPADMDAVNDAMRKLWEQAQTARVRDMMNRELYPAVYAERAETVSHYNAADALIAECVANAGWWLPYLEASK